MTTSLADLPEDILLLILTSLDSAHSVASLAISCKRLHYIVETEGWRIFTRTRFPSLSLPTSNSYGWDNLAESLTWQSRCWDRRSLSFRALLYKGRHERPRGPRGRSLPYIPFIDAHIDPDTREELLVWGAGESIIARRRSHAVGDKTSETVWHSIEGENTGHVRGYDDVTAVSIVQNAGGRPGRPGILTGRFNGDLSLYSAEDGSFGERITSFGHPGEREDTAPGAASDLLRQTQNGINSLDVLGQRNMVAATARTSVLLYDLPQEERKEIRPVTIFDLSEHISGYDKMTLCRAKWMADGTLLALGLRGCDDPLRYLSITPDGITLSTSAKNTAVEDLSVGYDKLCPTSIEPVNMSSIDKGGQFVLSAWRDGKCRLQDIRTPSPFDAVYCDNIDPWSELEALMPFGTERFIGGGMHGATLKVFDFRWTKSYYHTTALTCSGLRPFPTPHQPFATPPREAEGPARSCCDHLAGYRCRWHELSRAIYYRPNCNIFFSKALPPSDKLARVWSLARASDVSPNFYIGISGGIVEANLQPNGSRAADPTFGFRDDNYAGNRYGYAALDLGVSMMETGDGFAYPHNSRNIRMPTMHGPQRRPSFEWRSNVEQGLRKRHRLDSRFQTEEDFRNIS